MQNSYVDFVTNFNTELVYNIYAKLRPIKFRLMFLLENIAILKQKLKNKKKHLFWKAYKSF